MSVTTYTTVNGRILRQNKDGVVHNFVSDPLGSVVMVRDTSGNTVYTAEYDPYGNVQSETGTNPSEFGYVGTLGYVKDSASSLYVSARYLLTNLGRWLTKDPFWPSEPGFVYAGARPSMAVDPSGFKPPVFGTQPRKKRSCWDTLVASLPRNISPEDAKKYAACLATCVSHPDKWGKGRTVFLDCMRNCAKQYGKGKGLPSLIAYSCCILNSPDSWSDPCNSESNRCCRSKYCACFFTNPPSGLPNNLACHAELCEQGVTGESGCGNWDRTIPNEPIKSLAM